MIQKSTERGQALILIALAVIGLFAFAALAIDGSRAFSNKRHSQNAADTAVLTAALTQIRTGNFTAAEAAAQARAVDNGYLNNWDTIIVDVDSCVLTEIVDINPLTGNPVPGDEDPATGDPIPCQGVPAGKESEYIRVKIISEIPTTFGRVIGRETLQSAVQAVARVQGGGSSSSSLDNAVVALRQTNCGICGGGTVDLDVNGSGVFSNSTNSCSIDFTGTGTYDSEGGYTMPPPGGLCYKKAASNLTGDILSGEQVPYPPTNIDIPVPTFPCTGPARSASDATTAPDGTKVYPPGNYSGNLKLNNGNHRFENGTYCFANGIDMGANITVINANFRLTGGEFKSNGNVSLTCNGLLFHSAGGTGMHLNGNGVNTCLGVTFYMETGGVTWNGNSGSVLEAPTIGTDTGYDGLLIYLPMGNDEVIKINGNSGNEVTGSIIAPDSEIILSGNSGSTGFKTQLIGEYITLQGNSNTVINYDPSVLYPLPSATILQLDQ